MNAEEISLGFMEVERRVPRWFFPSKVGGLPIWQVGPPPTNLFCAVCTPQVPLTLLVQIYAPLEGCPLDFHRCLYVFCCLSCGRHFRALSSRLPRENAEYPSCAVSTFFESKQAFWAMWKQQQQQQKGRAGEWEEDRCSSGEHPAPEACSSSSSSTEPSLTAAAAAAAGLQQQQQQQQRIVEATKLGVIEQLQRGERLRQVCCCPVCGLPGGDIVGETERAAAAALLQQQLHGRERRLQVLLLQQKEEAAAPADGEETETPQAVQDLDCTDFEREDTEEDQRGLLLLDAAHIQIGRVLHPRCLKRLKFGSVFVSFPEFPLAVETEDLAAAEKRQGLDAALERLGLEGGELTHEEQLLRRYQQTIQDTPDADLDESEADAFEEIHQKYTTQDPQLEVFLKRCGQTQVKGHVIRYALGGKPLWPFSSQQLKTEDVPNCACGAPRQFEFQVQPQLISHLAERVGSSDPAATAALERLCFGLLAVYSCSASCDSCSPCRGYREEFVHAQPDPFYG